jgi:hypothetical protein
VNAAECGTQLGKIADVDLVMLGRATGGLVDGTKPGIAMVGIDLRLVDVHAGTELRHVSALLPSDAVKQTDAVNALSELFYGTDALVALEVVAAPPGAEVRVDGVPRGSAPLQAPVDSLAPGPHHVSVIKKGFLPFHAIVEVNKGEAARLEVTLEVDPEALRTGPTTFDIVLPFVIGGGGAAIALGGGVMTVVGLGPWFQYNDAVATIEGANPNDADYVATVTVANKEAREGASAWTTWGQGVTVAGITLVSVGTAAAGVGIGWGIYQLTRSDEAEAAGTAAPAE